MRACGAEPVIKAFTGGDTSIKMRAVAESLSSLDI
jgi:hypothetical protein